MMTRRWIVSLEIGLLTSIIAAAQLQPQALLVDCQCDLTKTWRHSFSRDCAACHERFHGAPGQSEGKTIAALSTTLLEEACLLSSIVLMIIWKPARGTLRNSFKGLE